MKIFKVGDVVALKSGGSSMTVREVYDSKLVCTWMVDGFLGEGDFSPQILELVKGERRAAVKKPSMYSQLS